MLPNLASTTFILTRSQPRNLLSMARVNKAKSRWFSANSSLTRIAQTCFGIKGRFWPTMRPLFQADRTARMAGRFYVSMSNPPIRHILPNRQPNAHEVVYHTAQHRWCIRSCIFYLRMKAEKVLTSKWLRGKHSRFVDWTQTGKNQRLRSIKKVEKTGPRACCLRCSQCPHQRRQRAIQVTLPILLPTQRKPR